MKPRNYVVLRADVVEVEDGSNEHLALKKAGWFTWDRGEDGERIMTRPKSHCPPVSKVLR